MERSIVNKGTIWVQQELITYPKASNRSLNQELIMSFLNKVRWRNMSSKFVRRFFTILSIPLYLLVIVLGLFIMVFAGLSSLFQRLTTSTQDLQQQRRNIVETEEQSEPWSIFTSADDVLIEQQLAGSLPWNSGDYVYLKSTPTIPYLTDKIFGYWLLVQFGGLFLQKWNHPRNINCDLVFIDFTTLKVVELQKGLPTKDWVAKKVRDDELKFTFRTSGGELTYTVRRTDLNPNGNY